MVFNESGRRGEIGRHDRLKICCPQGRVGSSPTAGRIVSRTGAGNVLLYHLSVINFLGFSPSPTCV